MCHVCTQRAGVWSSPQSRNNIGNTYHERNMTLIEYLQDNGGASRELPDKQKRLLQFVTLVRYCLVTLHVDRIAFCSRVKLYPCATYTLRTSALECRMAVIPDFQKQ
ncbi:hypothetical protein H2248_005521 [Termitomyces sp. 'cryptogamus']|nr:hypothetical protein H2248_005521 [Termitomyces sp. 'cryptogamus']